MQHTQQAHTMPMSLCPSSGGNSSDATGSRHTLPSNWTPLHEAVLQADKSAVQQLLQEGADLNAACEGGITPTMLVFLMPCYYYNTNSDLVSGIPQALHERLMVWAADVRFNPSRVRDDKPPTTIMGILMSYEPRVDLLFPGGCDMLEAAAVVGQYATFQGLLRKEPYRSMMDGTWSSSSSSSQPDDQRATDGDTNKDTPTSVCTTSRSSITTSTPTNSAVHDAARPDASTFSNHSSDTPAGASQLVPLNRHSQPLSWGVDARPESCLHLLQLGWQPELHPADAGNALLISCKKVRPATCWRSVPRSHVFFCVAAGCIKDPGTRASTVASRREWWQQTDHDASLITRPSMG